MGKAVQHALSSCALAFLTLNLVAATPSPAQALDTIRVAVSNIGFWSVETPRVGEEAGIFRKHGLKLEVYGTAAAGETLQAVIAGSADIGIGMGTSGALSAFAKGAPLRIIGANFTGASDLYWYVRADSPLQSLKDATEKQTATFSSNGSSSHITVLALLASTGSKARPQPSGNQASTLTQVMSGQIDIGYSAPPFGLQEVEDGKIRIIATGNDASVLRDQTVRVDIANLGFFESRRDVFDRFRAAYQETLEWMYSDPKAIEMWAKSINVPVRLAQIASDKFQPKDARVYTSITGLEKIMDDAIASKLLVRKLSKEELDKAIMLPGKQ